MNLADEIEHLAERVLGPGPAKTPPKLRRAAAERARFLAGLAPTAPDLPSEWMSYVDKVALHAYRVTDEDVQALKDAGHDEDEIFEVTVATAVGASVARGRAGFAALRGKS
jgi:alkylhydroperoxidase family enzyme